MSDTYLQQLRDKKLGLVADAPKDRKTIARISKKRKAQITEDKRASALDKEFFVEIWASSPHICQECECKLGNEPLTLFFHHLLEKRNHPEFRHVPENIVILCPDCHTQAESDLDKVPKVKARKNEILKLLLS